MVFANKAETNSEFPSMRNLKVRDLFPSIKEEDRNQYNKELEEFYIQYEKYLRRLDYEINNL
jgi:hypothetical protein